MWVRNMHVLTTLIPDQAQQPSLDVAASSPASPEDPSTATAAAAHAPVQQPHITTALPYGLMPLGEQLPAQSPLQLLTPLPQQLPQQLPSQVPQQQLPQLPPQGRPLASQAASQHQQLQGSISPGQQQPPQLPARVRVPLHKGVGLVRLCIPAEPPKKLDRPRQDAAPLLVAKYSAWPFTCLWPESPPSQPPPLPSQSPSPSPPPMPPRNRDPSHRPSDTQPGRTASKLVADGFKHVAAAPDAYRAAAALPQTAPAAVAATALRPSGKQAPKVLIEPSFVHCAGPFQPASKRQRGNLSVSPDDGRFGAHRASSRYCCQLFTVAAPCCWSDSHECALNGTSWSLSACQPVTVVRDCCSIFVSCCTCNSALTVLELLQYLATCQGVAKQSCATAVWHLYHLP